MSGAFPKKGIRQDGGDTPKMRTCHSETLAEKVLFRQIRQIGAKRDRLLHSCFIARRVGRRGFSARV